MARELDLLKNEYNPFETGSRRITLDAALILKARYGVPLDWVYCGDRLGVSAEILDKWRKIAA